MKIGIDLTTASYKNPTGVGKYTLNLIKNLLRIKSEFEFFFFYSFKVKKKNYLNLNGKHLPYLPQIFSLLYPKISLFHQPAFKYCRAKNFVVTFHDAIIATPFDFTSLHSKRYNFPKYKKAIEKARRIIVPSNFTKNEIIKYYGAKEEKIRVTHLGVEEEFFEIENNLKNRKNYFLFVGNIEKRKNLINLLISFENVFKKYPEFQLILIGKNGYKGNEVEDFLKEYSYKDKVKRLNYLEKNEILNYYKNAFALVFSSFYEGFGLPLLEAMASKTPVIASEISVFKEIARDSIIYFNPEDPKDISEKILYSIENRNILEKNVEKAHSIAKNFSWEKVATKTLNVYREVLNC